jgi:hypothetical protein
MLAMKDKTIGTGSERGTYKWGDKHPWLEDRLFGRYFVQLDRLQEQWMTKEKFDKGRENARKLKEKSRGGKKLNLQTGSDRGGFCMSDKHPIHSGYRFLQYAVRKGVTVEYWTTEAKWKISMAKKSDNNSKRRDKVGHWSSKPAFPLLYRFRDILNSQHPYAVHTGMFHVDHIKRLADGGEHVEGNLQLSTASWNLAKG